MLFEIVPDEEAPWNSIAVAFPLPKKTLLEIFADDTPVSCMPTDVLTIVSFEIFTVPRPFAVIAGPLALWRTVLAVSVPDMGRLSTVKETDSVYVPASITILGLVVLLAALTAAEIEAKQFTLSAEPHDLLTVNVAACTMRGEEVMSKINMENESTMACLVRMLFPFNE
ncbi:MAG TPA: hypothetical protein VEM40_01290 [Nitrospirota bacterium]|nr:hypothetical protein [Nitrospirota bacterium]